MADGIDPRVGDVSKSTVTFDAFVRDDFLRYAEKEYKTFKNQLNMLEKRILKEFGKSNLTAAHAGDIDKEVPGAMAKCRKELGWEGQFAIAMDPEKARRIRAESGVDEEHGACTMCGEFCAYKGMNERKTVTGGE
jgi:thiamine biosynthesis protein ThiC